MTSVDNQTNSNAVHVNFVPRGNSTGPNASDGVATAIGHVVVRPRQQIENRIRSLILSGELRSGEKLPSETELARQFQVSRATVREALRSLFAEGLLVRRGDRGGRVIVNSLDHRSLSEAVAESVQKVIALGTVDILEVSAVREYLEVPSARLAAVNASAKELEALRDIVAQEKALTVDDPRVPLLDREFHTGIAKSSGNLFLAAIVSALHSATNPVDQLELSPDVGRETVRQHQRLLDCLMAKEPDGATAAIEEHLSYLRGHVSAVRTLSTLYQRECDRLGRANSPFPG